MEIHRLHDMLTEAGIEHTFRERAEECAKPYYEKHGIDLGYQVVVYYPNGERMISAIEGWGTYGYGGWDHGLNGTTEKDGDLIEIMGLLTPEESEHDSVVGYLTAEEVFRRIAEAVDGLIEIIRWISIVLMWGATALNVYALIRSNRSYKRFTEMRDRYEETVKRYEEAVEETWAARDEYYDMIEEYRKRCLDEGEN